jgi:hypothetical protein
MFPFWRLRLDMVMSYGLMADKMASSAFTNYIVSLYKSAPRDAVARTKLENLLTNLDEQTERMIVQDLGVDSYRAIINAVAPNPVGFDLSDPAQDGPGWEEEEEEEGVVA